MSTLVNDILDLALQLQPDERASLARQLLLSLEPEPFDTNSEETWTAEIEARMKRVEQGTFSACDWREAIDRIGQAIKETSP